MKTGKKSTPRKTPGKRAARPIPKKERTVHRVEGEINLHKLSKAGTAVEFRCYAKNGMLGRLVIGSGSLTWWPAKNKSRHYSWTWSEFKKAIEND